MTQFFLSVHREEKLSHFDLKKMIHWQNQNSTQLFRSKWLNFFLSVRWEKKLSHFDLKSWVTGGIKIRPNFLDQNDSIFSISAPREKIESFWP